MAVGPIKYTDMVWYAERQGLKEEAVTDFCYVLSQMDDAWLKQMQEKPSTKSSKTPPGKRSRTKSS